MEPRSLKNVVRHRPIYHIAVESKTGKIVPQASRALTEEGLSYLGTNYDFTKSPKEQGRNPQVYLFRDLGDACVAKPLLNLLPGVSSARLTKFDGENPVRTAFTLEELEAVGSMRVMTTDDTMMEI